MVEVDPFKNNLRHSRVKLVWFRKWITYLDSVGDCETDQNAILILAGQSPFKSDLAGLNVNRSKCWHLHDENRDITFNLICSYFGKKKEKPKKKRR